MTNAQIKELAYGFNSGYTHGKWERENYNTKQNSNWICLYKDNLRKMISGCNDEHDLVVIYWQGYIQGFIKAATNKD